MPRSRESGSYSGAGLTAADRNAHRPDVAVGILQHDVAPTVREIARRRQHQGAGRTRSRLRYIRIDAHGAQLDTRAPQPRGPEPRGIRMVVVGMVGVQHELRTL